ncbi:hypothetical protein [Rhizohabitans arisaemae]|uniref:hypothetical protein n=1 Tax=Rhizohabitans arisaemae TaxID=2720610 RepID=UPI0024B23902|nr:hypothetical protein [Rhizohabitans arisaemae]
MNIRLTLFEARRLLRNPILWGTAVLALVRAYVQSTAWLPDMTIVVIDAVTASALIGAAMMIVSGLAAGRDRRHGLPETLAALPVRAVERTRAVILAAPAAGALLAAVMISVQSAAVSLPGGAAGRFDPYQALGGVALGALAATAGAALGRWLPWLITPPIVIVLVALAMIGDSRGENFGWFLPVIPGHSVAWGARPTGWHLVYLVAAVVLFAALALLRHGLRPLRTLVALTALAVAVPAGAAATAAAPVLPWAGDRAAFTPQLPEQVCEKHEGLTFCVYPDYRPWIPGWVDALRPILAVVPERARDRVPPIRQLAGYDGLLWQGSGADPLATPVTWTVWSADPARHRAYLAGQVIASAVGLEKESCGADLGRARLAVALWLAGRAGPLLDAPDPGSRPPSSGKLPKGWLDLTMGFDNGGIHIPGQLHDTGYGQAEVEYARALLNRPETADRIRADWDVLVSPSTTLEQGAALLGVRPGRPASRKDELCR